MGCCQSCCGKKGEKPVRANGNIPFGTVCLPLPVNDEVALEVLNDRENYHVIVVDVDEDSLYGLTDSYRSSIISIRSLLSRQEIIEKDTQIDPSYAADVLKALNDMRLNEFMTDLTIVVGGEGFRCHRAVIAAATPIWASIFLENEDVREFELSDYGPDIISRVIEFVYTSKLMLSNRNVEDILEVVRDLKMGAAEQACQEYLATVEGTERAGGGGVEERGPVSEHVFHQPLHAVEILLRLNSQRGGRKFTDCAISLENDEVLPCHRIVMSTCGDYWKEIFSETKMKSQLDDTYATVTLKSNAHAKAIVDFTYSSRLDVEEHNATELYQAASAIQHPGALRKCGNFLRRQLRPDNCLGVWALAKNHNDKLLLKSALRMALKQFAEVVENSDEFRQLSKEEIVEYLGQDGLHVKSEESVYEAVLTWLNHDQSQRLVFFPDLFAVCRLSFCSPTFVDSLLNKDKLISNNQPCRQLCEGARSQHTVIRNGRFEKDPRPRPRCSFGEIILSIGGATKNETWTNDMSYYNPQDQQWYQDGLFAPLETEATEYSACVLLNDIYVTGGIWNNKSVSNEVFRYNILFDEWTQTGKLQTPRWRHGVGVLGRKIYAVGGKSSGKNGRVDDDNCFLNSVERYSRQTDSWETIQPLPHGYCSRPVVTSYKSKLYVFGSEGLANCQCFDARKNTWDIIKNEELLDFYHPRAAVNIKGKIYIIGGRNQFSVNIFDAEMKTMKSGTSLDHDVSHVRDSYSVAYANGKIYVTGGRWKIGEEEDPLVIMTNGVDVYDPATDSWSVPRPMPRALTMHGLVTAKTYITNKLKQN